MTLTVPTIIPMNTVDNTFINKLLNQTATSFYYFLTDASFCLKHYKNDVAIKFLDFIQNSQGRKQLLNILYKNNLVTDVVNIQKQIAKLTAHLCVSVNNHQLTTFNNLFVKVSAFSFFNLLISNIFRFYPIIPFTLKFMIQMVSYSLCVKLGANPTKIRNDFWTLKLIAYHRITRKLQKHRNAKIRKKRKRMKLFKKRSSLSLTNQETIGIDTEY